jgi:hypothetical protein
MDLAMYSSLIQTWYQWGHLVALAVTAAVVFWIFYDAARRGVEPTLWKVATVVGVVLVLPALLLRVLPARFAGNLAIAVEPFAYLGLGGATLALVSLFLYLVGVGVVSETRLCPDCGQPQHPSWEYCPYCAQREAQQVAAAAAVPPPPPPPSPPLPTVPVAPQSFEAPSPQVEKTEVIRPARPETLAWLVPHSGAHAGREMRLGETATIGRNPAQCDVVLDDSIISRQHAKVKLEEGQFVLYDLASTIGTFVKDRESGEWVEVHKHALVDGDQIKIGHEILSFVQVTTGEQA